MSYSSRIAVSFLRSLRLASPLAKRILAAPCVTATRPVYSRSTANTFSAHTRYYSTSNDKKESLLEDIAASHEPDSPMGQVMNNPAVLKTLIELNEYLLEKKYIADDGQPPGMFAVMRMLGDSEFKDKLRKVKKTMDEEGIQLTEADLMRFAQTFGLNFKK